MWVFPPLEIANDMDNKSVYFKKHIAHVKEFGKIAVLLRSERYTGIHANAHGPDHFYNHRVVTIRSMAWGNESGALTALETPFQRPT